MPARPLRGLDGRSATIPTHDSEMRPRRRDQWKPAIATGVLPCYFRARLRSVWRICVLAMALLWVPLTAHCRIASLPGLEFLRCAEDGDAHGNKAGTSDADCDCCEQEHGKYHASRWENPLPDSMPDVGLPVAWANAWSALAPDETDGILTAAPHPPPRAASWIFDRRLALPVRAPSSAS